MNFSTLSVALLATLLLAAASRVQAATPPEPTTLTFAELADLQKEGKPLPAEHHPVVELNLPPTWKCPQIKDDNSSDGNSTNQKNDQASETSGSPLKYILIVVVSVLFVGVG